MAAGAIWLCAASGAGLAEGQITGGETEGCLRLESSFGDKCANTKSMRVSVRNDCKTPQRIWICLKRLSGQWDCGLRGNVLPGQEVSGYVCAAAVEAPGEKNREVVSCDAAQSCKAPH